MASIVPNEDWKENEIHKMDNVMGQMLGERPMKMPWGHGRGMPQENRPEPCLIFGTSGFDRDI